jgi:hypothetical protein
MNILSIDPALATFGYVVVHIDLDNAKEMTNKQHTLQELMEMRKNTFRILEYGTINILDGRLIKSVSKFGKVCALKRKLDQLDLIKKYDIKLVLCEQVQMTNVNTCTVIDQLLMYLCDKNVNVELINNKGRTKINFHESCVNKDQKKQCINNFIYFAENINNITITDKTKDYISHPSDAFMQLAYFLSKYNIIINQLFDDKI